MEIRRKCVTHIRRGRETGVKEMKEIGKVKLNYQYYPGVDLYSDGDIEDELLQIVKNHTSDEWNRIIASRQSWPILYHLSHIRENIIEWLPICSTDRVLEIGSGCGAVTGCLADKAQKVTCIELSEKRSLINAYRNQNRGNIEILLGNFEEIERNLNETFDYITLIGVLEYGEKYITGECPYETFLKAAKKHLRPGGSVIIAIENKMGMKYWAGCKEDHIGRYFEGIEDYTQSNGVKTFSKHELEELLRRAGFTNFKFYYPYPDYKLPTVIYSDEYLPKEGELDRNMCNFDQERVVLFNEVKAFNTVLRAGVFPLFSNSYLISAKSEG